MRILIAPDKFKESLTAMQVAAALRDGFHSVLAEASFDIVPVADGGEGTAGIFHEALGGDWVEVATHDALGRPVKASYAWIPSGEFAVIDMSAASGLWRIPADERDPSHSSTFGTGELALDAINHGAKSLVIGLGGSATNDAGVGMAVALGWKFLDLDGQPVAPYPADFGRIRRIVAPAKPHSCSVTGLCDVGNPLLGESGATRIFGAQKGVTPDALPLLEDGVRLSEELGVKAYLASWTVNLAGGLLAAGNLTRARETAQRALDLALAHKERGHQAYALRLLGEIAARSEPRDLGLAEKDLTQALALAEELGMRPLLGRIHLSLGEMSRLGGDHGKAEAHIFHAISLFREMDMRHWLEEAAGQLKALGHLLVIAHYNLGLYDFLKERYAEDAEVTVVLDRRRGERRRPGHPPGSERRASDRRGPELRDGALRLHGFVVIPTEPAR